MDGCIFYGMGCIFYGMDAVEFCTCRIFTGMWDAVENGRGAFSTASMPSKVTRAGKSTACRDAVESSHIPHFYRHVGCRRIWQWRARDAVENAPDAVDFYRGNNIWDAVESAFWVDFLRHNPPFSPAWDAVEK